MPIAQPYNIPIICDIIKQKKPKTVLDVGCGFGLYGFLTRIYSGLWTTDLPPEKYKNWREITTVDGIEVFEPWITDLQKLIYNNIYIGDMRDKINEVGYYDLIIMGDCIEHLTKEDGLKVLETAREKSKALIISTPDYWARGEEKGGNKWELHQHLWQDSDFPDSPKIIYEKQQKIKVVIYD